jgi:hypothetical protein
MSKTEYQCVSDGCTLGSRKQPGRFTGGMTAEQKNLLTGAPLETLKDGTDFGEGICPNCGDKGQPYDHSKPATEFIKEQIRSLQADLKEVKS